MRSLIKTTSTALIFGLGLSFALGSQRAAAETPSCTDWTLRGSYEIDSSGSFTPDGVTFVQIAEVGLIAIDGRGQAAGNDTISFAGNVFTRALTGTYSVNRDCTYTVVVVVDGNPQNLIHLSGVIVDNGASAVLVSTDPGATLTVRSRRLRPL